MEKMVEVVIGVLVRPAEAGKEVLVAKRKQEAVLGGLWEFPGGKLDPGETKAECLAREFREELAIEVQAGDALPLIEHRYDHATVRLHPLWCELVDPTAKAKNLQVAEHRWVKAAELRALTFPEANTDLIEVVATALQM